MVSPDPWQSLLSHAILGERAQDRVSAPGALGAVLARIPATDPISTVALVTAWRRAGRRPLALPAAQLPGPAPAEVLPEVSPAAARLLQRFVGSHPDRVLAGQWLQRCAAAQRRVPPVLSAVLLDLGRTQVGLREALRLVLGNRGAWLAHQHEAWCWASTPSTPDTWQTADLPARCALVRAQRLQDPAAARALIASTWHVDPPQDRVAFLELLRVGLQDADEALLERALDDRRKEVREVAGELLRSLPASALVGRCRDRLAPLWHWSGGRLQAEPPAAFDPAWVRDGLSEKPPAGTGAGARAWWLRQLLGAVPVGVWTSTWGIALGTLLAACRDSAWARDIGHALEDSCARTPDAAWVTALLAQLADQDQSVAYRLLAGLPRPDQERILLERYGTVRTTLLSLVARLASPWSLDFSQQVVATCDGTCTGAEVALLPVLATSLHPGCAPRLASAVLDDGHRSFLDAALAILDTRRQILQEFP